MNKQLPPKSIGKLSCKMVIISHLSDLQEIITGGDIQPKECQNRINFTKHLVLKYSKDINQDIDPVIDWKEFMLTRFYQP